MITPWQTYCFSILGNFPCSFQTHGNISDHLHTLWKPRKIQEKVAMHQVSLCLDMPRCHFYSNTAIPLAPGAFLKAASSKRCSWEMRHIYNSQIDLTFFFLNFHPHFSGFWLGERASLVSPTSPNIYQYRRDSFFFLWLGNPSYIITNSSLLNGLWYKPWVHQSLWIASF